MDVRKRIERQKDKILKLKDELEQAQEEYEKLQEELKAQEQKELFEAFEKSSRSYEEVIEFLKGKADI